MKRLVMLVVGVVMFMTSGRLSAEQDPLAIRVTIDYRNATAADVIGALARVAGLPLEVSSGDLRPVTITLTNVKLGTALNAVCENASCTWRLQAGLKITPLVEERSATLPAHVSIDLHDTPASDVFRALATAMNVPVMLDFDPSGGPISIQVKDALTTDVLNMLCKIQHCEWAFDARTGLRVSRQRQGGR